MAPGQPRGGRDRSARTVRHVENSGHLKTGLTIAGLLRAQVGEIHRDLDECLTAWLSAMAPAIPPAGSHIVALYLHAVTVEDLTVQSLLRRVPPVFETDWAGRGPAQYSMADLAPLRAYAQQVFATTDAYLAGLRPEDARRVIDLSRLGQGHPTVAWVISKFIVLSLAQISGELSGAVQPP